MFVITQNKTAPYWSITLKEKPSTIRVAEIKKFVDEFVEDFELYNVEKIEIDISTTIAEPTNDKT